MKLSDIMSGAGLSIHAQVALVIFFGVFIAIVARTFSPSRRAAQDEAARLPLDDGQPASRPAER